MSDSAFEVDNWTHWLGGLVARHRSLCVRLGNLETRLLGDELQPAPGSKPIYVAGLARSGSTILLEKLAALEGVVSHRYRDFPGLFTPVAWNRFLDRVPNRGRETAAERSHKDGIMVTRESPEALEEMLWMAFFPDSHDPHRCAVLDGHTEHAAFARFYAEHQRKLLYLRGGQRYVAKGNYNLTRFEYLQKLFAGARFVVPIRSPASHIGSLMKQQRLFAAAEARHPRALAYMRRVGHFEFGLDRRPVNVGDHASMSLVLEAWRRGDEVLGWARYWAMLHRHLADRLDASPGLRAAVHLVPFEQLCGAPRDTLTALYRHCGLDIDDNLVENQAATIRFPDYYKPEFAAQDLAVIERETAEVAARFGYTEERALGRLPSPARPA